MLPLKASAIMTIMKKWDGDIMMNNFLCEKKSE